MRAKGVLATLAVAACASTLFAGPAFAGGQGDPLLGDVNADGRTDRATLVELPGQECGVDVELGQAGGGFGTATRYTWPNPAEIGYCPDMGVILDLGGDGASELLLAYFWGRPPGVDTDLIVLEDFTPAGGFDAIFQPSFIGLENFNTDDLVDVYEWTDQGSGLVTWLNTPSGQLVPGPVHQAALDFDFAFADFDRNGATDVVIGYTGAYPQTPDTAAVVILDDGRRVTLRDDGGYYGVDALDASGDGKLDVRLDNADTGEVVHFIGNGRGGFTEAPNAVDDTVQVRHREQKTISVLVNDAATTNATLRIVTPPAYGTIVRTTSKGFVYRNTAKHDDSFVYELTVDGKTDTATANLRVR